MNKITVKKVKANELTKEQVFLLNYKYKTELGKFVVMYDWKTETLYTNDGIEQKDIEKMLEIAEYEGEYINDPKCEVAEQVEYIYQKYGIEVYRILRDTYNHRKKEVEDKVAKKEAKRVYSFISDYIMDNNIKDVFCDMERLVYHVEVLARASGRKTTENLVDYGTKYTFLMGYLMGNGAMSEVLQSGNK